MTEKDQTFIDTLGVVFKQTMLTGEWKCSYESEIVSSPRFFTEAARFGNIDILEWLKKYGCPINIVHVCRKAAKNGHLHVIEWCIENYPDEEWQYRRVCESAVSGGQLEILKWLKLNNCPWNKEECKAKAKRKGFTEICEWIDKN